MILREGRRKDRRLEGSHHIEGRMEGKSMGLARKEGRKEGRKEHVQMYIKERREENAWIIEGRKDAMK